jgi:SAM-dependent methyltransferase
MMGDWEGCYQAGDTPWDKGVAHPSLAETLGQVPVSGRVLVPGCGFGYDVAAIARVPAVSEAVGLDIAASAVAGAKERLAGVGRARVIEGDLFARPQEAAGGFDWVWEHTCFCAIDPSRRNDYVDAVAGWLRPGGQLLGVFYLRPWDTEEENRTSGPPFGCTAEELDRRFAPRFEIVRAWDPPATYPGREGREQMRWLRRV